MPKIQMYEPAQNAAAPHGAMSPNLDMVSAAGRGIERLSRDFGEAARSFNERQTQLQNQIAYEDVTDKRVQFLQALQDQKANGTFDADAMGKQFDDMLQNVPKELTNGPAQDSWTRGMTRLKGMLLSQGIKAQTAIAVNNAQASANNTISRLATATQIDPSTYKDNMEEAVHTAADTIPSKDHDKFMANAAHEITKAHVLGTANPQGANDPDTALTLLHSPEYAKYIKYDSYNALVNQVQGLKRAKDNYDENEFNRQRKLSASVRDSYLLQVAPQLQSGKVTPGQAFANAPKETTADDRMKILEYGEKLQKNQTSTNKFALDDAYKNIHGDNTNQNAINSVADIYGLPNIAPADKDKLVRSFLSSSRGAGAKAQDGLMYKAISSAFTPPAGIQDPDKAANIQAQFHRYLDMKDKMIQEGKDPMELSNKDSSSYFLKSVPKMNLQDIMQKNAQRLLNSVSGTPQANPNEIVHTAPGIAPSPTPVEMMDKETGKVWLMEPKTKKFMKWKEVNSNPELTPGTPPGQTPAIAPNPPPTKFDGDIPQALLPANGGQ